MHVKDSSNMISRHQFSFQIIAQKSVSLCCCSFRFISKVQTRKVQVFISSAFAWFFCLNVKGRWTPQAENCLLITNTRAVLRSSQKNIVLFPVGKQGAKLLCSEKREASLKPNAQIPIQWESEQSTNMVHMQKWCLQPQFISIYDINWSLLPGVNLSFHTSSGCFQ